MALGEAGAFRPDRATIGRHTRIMMRFERAIEEAGDAPLDMVALCRRWGHRAARSRRWCVSEPASRPGNICAGGGCGGRARCCAGHRDTTVTDVAFRLGFWHLSRFAAAYASTFGERPSITLARANGTSTH